MESKSSRVKNIIIIILSFLLGVLLSYFIFTLIAGRSMPRTPQADTPNSQTPVQEEPLTIAPNPSNPDENIATIPSLHMSFRYSKYEYSFNEDHPGLNRMVTVNPPQLTENVLTFGPSYESSLRIYTKEPGQSLETAVRNMFLNGIPTTSCQLIRVQPGSEYQYYPASNNISYVVMNPLVPNGCSTQFDTTNPSMAFFSFSNNPGKFFLAIGEPDASIPLLTANGEPFWVTMKFN